MVSLSRTSREIHGNHGCCDVCHCQPVLAEVYEVKLSISDAVDAATRTCPPWPASMVRAVRFNAGMK